MAIRWTTGSGINLDSGVTPEFSAAPSSQESFQYSRRQFSFIDRGLWQIMSPYHAGFDTFQVPNFALREGSERERLEMLRGYFLDCILGGDEYLFQIHFASLEEIIRTAAADQGLPYHEPRDIDIPTFDFAVQRGNFEQNPEKFLVVETQTGMAYELVPTLARMAGIADTFGSTGTQRVHFSIPRSAFGVSQDLEQVYTEPRWKQLEGSMTKSGLPRPLYQMSSPDGEMVLTGLVMPELDQATKQAEAKQDFMAAGKDFLFAVLAAGGSYRATSNSWLARQPFMPSSQAVDMKEVIPGIWVRSSQKSQASSLWGHPVAEETQPTTSLATTRATTRATTPIYPSTIVGRSLKPARRMLLNTGISYAGTQALTAISGPLSQGAAALTGVALQVDAVRGVVVDRVTQAMLTWGVERLLGTVIRRNTNPPEEGGVPAYADQPLPSVPGLSNGPGAAANPDAPEHRRLAGPEDIRAHVVARCANDPKALAVYNELNEAGLVRMREDGSVYVRPIRTWSEGRLIVDVIWREALAKLGFQEGQKLAAEDNERLRNAMQDIGAQIDKGDSVGIGKKSMNESLKGLWAWRRFMGTQTDGHTMTEVEARSAAFTHGPNNRGAILCGWLQYATDTADTWGISIVMAVGGYRDVGRLLIETYAAEKVGLRDAQGILLEDLNRFFDGKFDFTWDEATYAERFRQQIGQLVTATDHRTGLGPRWRTHNPIQSIVSSLGQSEPADALRTLQTWRESIRLSYTQPDGTLTNEGLCFSAAVLAGFLSEFTTRLFQVDYKVEGWDQQRLQRELWRVVMDQTGELDAVLGQMGTDVRVPNEASLYTLREHLQGVLRDTRSSEFVTEEDRVVIDRVLKRWDRVLLWNDAYRIRSGVIEDKVQTVREANLLVPLQIPGPSTAPRIISTQDVVFLARVLRETTGQSEYRALRIELEKRLRGIWVCDANCDQLTGSDTTLAEPIGRFVQVYDHHGRFTQPHGTNATHLVLNRLEEVLEQKNGDVAAAKAALNVQDVSTDNMFDGITCAWIVAHIDRVLADAGLRTFLRQVATFEDFTAFTGRYDRNSSEAMFVAAMAAKGNQVLTRRGIMGSDRFSADQTSEIVTEMMTHFDRMLNNEGERARFAGQFWSEIDRAVTVVVNDALLVDQSVAGQFSMFDDSQLINPGTGRQFPVLTRWLTYPLANQNPVQVVATPLSTGRYLYILANRHGETLPCGRDISVALDALNRAEGRATWTAREDVVAHFGAGSKLKPAEVSAILRDPANGFFEGPR